MKTPVEIGAYIVEWFEANKRDLPWRHPEVQCDPYAVWISEVMLQQTQAPRVVPFFVKFMERFPDVKSLASAEWEEVMEYVRGLGYYRRFRNLIVGAKMVRDEFGGVFPRDYEALRRLPGVGEYTAGAILAFACDRDIVAMDTNVRRVLKHFFGELPDTELKKIAAEACPHGRAKEFYQGMMDYAAAEMGKRGERVGAAKKLQKTKHNREPRSLTPIIHVRVAAGIIWRKGANGIEVLIQTRINSRSTVYEFPGGKIEPRETERACLKRELMEELGIEAAVRPPFLKTEFSFGDKLIRFSWHRCQILLGEPYGKEGQEVRWIPMSELHDYSFPPSNEEVLKHLAVGSSIGA